MKAIVNAIYAMETGFFSIQMDCVMKESSKKGSDMVTGSSNLIILKFTMETG